jgi:predicted RNA binding protein YcfA (HicA-like mRNA interferase family)
MKIRKLIELIESDGWELDRQKGDHKQYKHPGKPGLVTISGHPDDEIRPGTLSSILKQAGIRRKA